MEILILSSSISKRAEYVFRLVFEDLLETKFRITFDKEEFQRHLGAKINYSNTCYGDAINIEPVSLLFEKKIEVQDIKTITVNEINCIFKTDSAYSDLPFDIFAAIFFLTSRYEEYLPYKVDKYGRFEAKESIAFKLGFIDKPVVNIWVQYLGEILNKKFPGAIYTKKQYSFLPTYDIDIAYSYLGKPLSRSLASALRDLLTGHFNLFRKRLNVLSGKEKDPFDSYDYILSTHKKHSLKSVFFIHPGTYGKVDKNIPLKNKNIISLIGKISKDSSVGLHPSYRSVNEPELLKKECKGLEKITKEKIIYARQHFIYLKLPDIFRNYLKNNITDDFSIGYASHTGFRAGICTPFFFYDLLKEEETILVLHPFAFMDGACKNYMGLSSDETIEHLEKLIDEVRKVNGIFISLWHNESLSETSQWKGWREVYEFMIEKAIS
jgi:hypothetical protein